MKRLLTIVVIALTAGAALTSCGGTDKDASESANAAADKLTIVGAGS